MLNTVKTIEPLLPHICELMSGIVFLNITPVPPRKKSHQLMLAGYGFPAASFPDVEKMKVLL